MVRVISQKFSPPRSRHSSGETDRDLAERTNLALSSLGGKKLETVEHNESSSDSFWDSEFDGEHCEAHFSETSFENQDINGNNSPEKSDDLQSKRRERRRERNKLSAQAYRKRRRNQSAKDQEQVSFLESKNRYLHKLVDKLEKDREQGKQFLRGCAVPMPDFLLPSRGLSQRSKKELNPVPEEPSIEEAAAAHQSAAAQVAAQPAHTVEHTEAASAVHATVTNLNHSIDVQTVCNQNNFSPKPATPIQAQPPSQINNHFQHPPVNENVSLNKSNPSESNANYSQFNLFPAQILTTEKLSKQPATPQLLLPTHALIGASVAPQDGSSFSACAIPAYVAVPVENSLRKPQYFANNTNLNLNFSCPVVANTESNMNMNDEKLKVASNMNANSTFINCNEVEHRMSSPVANPAANVTIKTNTLVGLVQVELCNSNNVSGGNLNLNMITDDNGNRNRCDNFNTNVVQHKSSPVSLQTFNLNQNQESFNEAENKLWCK